MLRSRELPNQSDSLFCGDVKISQKWCQKVYHVPTIVSYEITQHETLCLFFRKLVTDPKVKLKYQHLITNSFVEVSQSTGSEVLASISLTI